MLKGKRVHAVPGLIIMRLVSAATSEDGRRWPVGTEYTPLSSGVDNRNLEPTPRGKKKTWVYQTIHIVGTAEQVRFLFPAK